MLKKIIMLILAAFCAMAMYCVFQIVKMDLDLEELTER